jgi:hypothetical protein
MGMSVNIKAYLVLKQLDFGGVLVRMEKKDYRGGAKTRRNKLLAE